MFGYVDEEREYIEEPIAQNTYLEVYRGALTSVLYSHDQAGLDGRARLSLSSSVTSPYVSKPTSSQSFSKSSISDLDMTCS